MPKVIDYPLNDISACIEISRMIFRYKRMSKEQCAEESGSAVSGQFQTLLSSAAKYKLITQKQGVLYSAPLIEEIELAYSDDDRKEAVKKSILSCGFFEHFFASETVFVPMDYLEKKLVKEYGVDSKKASVVAQIILKNKVFIDDAPSTMGVGMSADDVLETHVAPSKAVVSSSGIMFKIQGESLSCSFDCVSEDDFDIAQKLLEKARRLSV